MVLFIANNWIGGGGVKKFFLGLKPPFWGGGGGGGRLGNLPKNISYKILFE